MGKRGWVVTSALVAVAIVAAGAWMLRPADDPVVAAPTPPVTAMPTLTPAPSPTPTSTDIGPPADTVEYPLPALPQVNVFAVVPGLPVDDDPYGAFTGESARSRDRGAPVFAEPGSDPVAYLPREYPYGGTFVPVIERTTHWVKVLLTGRQAVPSNGDPAQVVGWLRAQDVEFAPLDEIIEVSISDRTVDVWRGGVRERIATDFGWGTVATPTPLGRAFVMTVRTEPSFWYTRGHPLVYLSVQSPTLDGFGGADAAVTAFHYHDTRSGSVSNGCIRLDADAIDKLATLPEGTPVIIRG